MLSDAVDAWPAPEVGKVLHDTYKLVRLIARGGMGTVFEAQHLRLSNRTVAIKMLTPSGEADETMMMRFQQEAEIISSLRHPNIVRIIDFNVLSDGRPYLVMEYLHGEDLGQRARRGGGRLPPRTLLEVLRQVARGLNALHRRGIVHRDLKPGNIFLAEGTGAGMQVKLLDFGLSKILDAGRQLTRDMTLLGTPNYCSPEQMLEHCVDHRADIFALGVTVFWALSGTLPFEDRSIINVIHKACFGERPSLAERAPGLPPAVDQVVWRALEASPDERYQQVDQLVADLEDVLDPTWGSSLPGEPAGVAANQEPAADQDEVLDLTEEAELIEDDPEEHVRTTRMDRSPFYEGRVAVPVDEETPVVQPLSAGPGVAPAWSGGLFLCLALITLTLAVFAVAGFLALR